jgi:hypothetical protein
MSGIVSCRCLPLMYGFIFKAPKETPCHSFPSPLTSQRSILFLQGVCQVKNSRSSMELERSWPYSQEPAIRSYPERFNAVRKIYFILADFSTRRSFKWPLLFRFSDKKFCTNFLFFKCVRNGSSNLTPLYPFIWSAYYFTRSKNNDPH